MLKGLNFRYSRNWKEIILPFLLLLFFTGNPALLSARQNPVPTLSYSDGKIKYGLNDKGDRIPDFSYSGYAASERAIPVVPTKFFLSPPAADATELIQAAIDAVGKLPVGKDGFRGAILLDKGVFRIDGQIIINQSGIVLRGSGTGAEGTVILGSGEERKTLIRILGKDDRIYGDTIRIADEYVPVNSRQFNLVKSNAVKNNVSVFVVRSSSEKWIDELGTKDFGGETGWIGWKPGDHDLMWDRKVTSITQGGITLDVPITTAIDKNYGGGYILPYEWKGRIENIGIENLLLQSSYNEANPKDESHRWMGITMENVQDAWVRQVNFENFAGSAVAVYSTGRKITVEDIKSLNPVSEIGGGRRNTFFVEGQQVLFQRCFSEYGYHDFSTGLAVAGPNAFVQCEARLPYSFSGGQQGWASGLLFDNVKIDGNAIIFNNLQQEKRGAGWTVANSVIWQSDAAKIENFSPPTANNWAFGVWAQFSGDGHWQSVNSHVKPQSLFYAQLEERLGKLPFDPQIIPTGAEPSTSPSLEQAKELTILAREDLTTLSGWIQDASQRNPIALDRQKAKAFQLSGPSDKDPKRPTNLRGIQITDGLLLGGKGLLTGSRHQVSWWRGSLRPRDIAAGGAHITRFAPGRYGKGLTDDIDEVITGFNAKDIVALDHNYGLWYDRRRDDHQRVRRMDGEVWAPFYEQPFARSGLGTAWDGLSKYDLTQFNPWYWDRLKEFADKSEKENIILIHQNYFQHNILEAGAHWADSPWRTANNINNTGFAEPAPYAGDKRIFLDEQFYDITHPVRRELHRSYIKKCLDNFADNNNVLQLVSAEYTGPLHFVEFWLDVIKEWKLESGKEAMIGLSTTKDVQDALLADKERAGLIHLIDIRYWYPTEKGYYAPEGGAHLSPRQHARQMGSAKITAEAVYEAVQDYRTRYPEKAVIFSHPSSAKMSWAVLFAGGSLPELPKMADADFAHSLATMRPKEGAGENLWVLQNDSGEKLIYNHQKQEYKEEWTGGKKGFEVLEIHPDKGIMERKAINNKKQNAYIPIAAGQLVWIKKSR